jgi:hypothetical protein
VALSCANRVWGQTVKLEPLSADHVCELWQAAEHAEASWAYLRYGPFETEADLAEFVSSLVGRREQPFWAVRPLMTNHAQGWLSLCDVYPMDGAIEIGVSGIRRLCRERGLPQRQSFF